MFTLTHMSGVRIFGQVYFDDFSKSTMSIISLPCGPFECHSDGTITFEGQPVNVNLSSKGYEYFCHKGTCYQVSDLRMAIFLATRMP